MVSFTGFCSELAGGVVTGAATLKLIRMTRSFSQSNFARKAMRSADDVCFVAGTIIITKTGSKVIEEIKTGDTVLTFNEVNKRIEYNVVSNIFNNQTNKLIKIIINTDTVFTTPEHPFFYNNTWTEAKNLKPGYLIKSAVGYASVKQVELIDTTNISVFNFEVSQSHTYFVAKSGYLVHNLCRKVKWSKQDYKNEGIKEAIDHIMDGHSYKASKNPKIGDTYFNKKYENKSVVKQLVEEAIGKAKSSHDLERVLNRDGSLKGYSVKYDTGKKIGTNGETKIQIYLDKDFSVRTAFPVE